MPRLTLEPPTDPAAPPADPAAPPADPAASTPPADPEDPRADPATPPADPATPATLTLKAPDGAKIADGHLDQVVALAKENGWTQEVAQQVLERELTSRADGLAAGEAASKEARSVGWDSQVDKWGEEAMADPTIGGDNMAQTLTRARAVIERFGDADTARLLDAYGFISHKGVLTMLNKIGASMGEATELTGRGSDVTPAPESREETAKRLFPNSWRNMIGGPDQPLT